MTYQEAVDIINSLLVFGSKPGLERIRELVDRAGAPDRKLRFVHVAGTNGKGSTCTLTAAALTAAGYKTGLFISPYVLEFRERFMINGKMIPAQVLADITEELYPLVVQMKDEGKIITEFEFVLAIALTWYSRENCDVVVLETGLGGRFDATNIISPPLVSAITSVSLDHTAILGDTCEKIAFEKCGIIKHGSPVVAYADQPQGVMEVIEKTAAERGCELIKASDGDVILHSADITGSAFSAVSGGRKLELRLRMPGDHQIKNAMTALEILNSLKKQGFSIPDKAIQSGFASLTFPARMEVLSEKPLIILDGAHNPGGAAVLSRAIKEYLPGKRKVGIVGMLADKDVGGALSQLLPLFDEIITTEPPNPRKMSSSELSDIVRKYCPSVIPAGSRESAFSLALSHTGEDDALIIFGSLYLASEMRKIVLEKQ